MQNRLVEYARLGMALNYVLEALRAPVESQIFKFGVIALEQFKDRLHEWPQFVHQIASVPHLPSVLQAPNTP